MQSIGDILIIDNEPTIVGLIAEVLTDEGYTVRTALNPEDARATITEQHP
jgi:DNA-binding response OmpR family regulator